MSMNPVSRSAFRSRIRIQGANWKRIHADPDPQHWLQGFEFSLHEIFYSEVSSATQHSPLAMYRYNRLHGKQYLRENSGVHQRIGVVRIHLRYKFSWKARSCVFQHQWFLGFSMKWHLLLNHVPFDYENYQTGCTGTLLTIQPIFETLSPNSGSWT